MTSISHKLEVFRSVLSGGFEIAVDDALFARCFESLRDLPRDRQRLRDRDWPAGDVGREVFALGKRHHESA